MNIHPIVTWQGGRQQKEGVYTVFDMEAGTEVATTQAKLVQRKPGMVIIIKRLLNNGNWNPYINHTRQPCFHSSPSCWWCVFYFLWKPGFKINGMKNSSRQHTIFFIFSSSSSHSRPIYTACAPKARNKTAREIRILDRRVRSLAVLYPFDDMAPVFRASSEGSGGEKSKVGTLDMGIGSTGLFIGVESAGFLLVSGFGGGFAWLFNESRRGGLAGGTGGFWERHLTDRIKVRRGIDLARIKNIILTVGFEPKQVLVNGKNVCGRVYPCLFPIFTVTVTDGLSRLTFRCKPLCS